MNYLAHGLDFLDDPYEAAGAAVPDWLCLTRPRVRCRSRQAARFLLCGDCDTAAIARGVVRHHADDDWFHQTAAFGAVSLELARQIRRATGDADGMRPSFLGHILVELLLDASLIEGDPQCVARYYAVLAEVDAAKAATAVGAMAGCDATALAEIITRFREVRFLYDYLEDERLIMRLNQVLHRVRLPALPPRFCEILPSSRALVAAHQDALLGAGLRDGAPHGARPVLAQLAR